MIRSFDFPRASDSAGDSRIRFAGRSTAEFDVLPFSGGNFCVFAPVATSTAVDPIELVLVGSPRSFSYAKLFQEALGPLVVAILQRKVFAKKKSYPRGAGDIHGYGAPLRSITCRYAFCAGYVDMYLVTDFMTIFGLPRAIVVLSTSP